MSMKKLNINVVILSVKVIVRLDFSSGSVVKNLTTNAGDARDGGSIPGWGKSPGEGNGKPLQYSCWGNPMERVAWWATVDGLTRVRHDLVIKQKGGYIASILLSVLIDLKWLWTCQFIMRGLKEIPKNFTEYLYKYIMESWFLSTKK